MATLVYVGKLGEDSGVGFAVGSEDVADGDDVDVKEIFTDRKLATIAGAAISIIFAPSAVVKNTSQLSKPKRFFICDAAVQ